MSCPCQVLSVLLVALIAGWFLLAVHASIKDFRVPYMAAASQGSFGLQGCEEQQGQAGNPRSHFWVAVKELHLSYNNSETRSFGIYPY